jgi:hypothetical protein
MKTQRIEKKMFFPISTSYRIEKEKRRHARKNPKGKM